MPFREPISDKIFCLKAIGVLIFIAVVIYFVFIEI